MNVKIQRLHTMNTSRTLMRMFNGWCYPDDLLAGKELDIVFQSYVLLIFVMFCLGISFPPGLWVGSSDLDSFVSIPGHFNLTLSL